MIDRFKDIFLKNKETPIEYWSSTDKRDIQQLKKQSKESIVKFRQDNSETKHYNSHYEWYQKNENLLVAKYDEAIKSIYNKSNTYETDNIINLLDGFIKMYNLDDIRVFLIVKEFLRNYILNDRIQKEILSSSMIDSVEDYNGNVKKLPNTLLRSKLDFSNLYLKTIELLDKITKTDELVDSEVKKNTKLTDLFSKMTGSVIDVGDEK